LGDPEIPQFQRALWHYKIASELNANMVVASRSSTPTQMATLKEKSNGKEPSIKRVWSFLEIVISATLLVAGLFLLQEGIANKSTSTVAMLILAGSASRWV